MANYAGEFYREQIAQARSDLRTLQRRMVLAWSVTAVMAALVVLIGWWGMRESGSAAVAAAGAQAARQTAEDARIAMADLKLQWRSAQERAAAAADEARQRARQTEQAVARAHDMELQLSQLEAELERDRLAAATEN